MNILTIEKFFTLGVVVYAVLMAGLGLLIARKRNWKLGLVRIGVTVVAALAALPMTRALAAYATDLAYGMLAPTLDGALRDLVTAAPVGVEGLRVLIALIAAPLLFLLVFIVLRLVGAIIVAILGGVVPPLHHKGKRALTWSLGAVNGVAIALVTLIPLCGFMVLGGRMLGTMVETEMTKTDFVQNKVMATMDITEDDMVTLSETLESNPVVTVVYGTIGKPAFTYLTTTDLDTTGIYDAADGDTLSARPAGVVPVAVPDESGRPTVVFLTGSNGADKDEIIRMNLEKEMCSLLGTVSYVMQAMDCIGAEEFTEADKDVLFSAVDSIFDSDSRWVSMLAGDTLIAFSGSWLEGEAFLGLERPALGDVVDPLLDCILEVLATEESSETLHEDVRTVVDVVGDLLVNDVFADGLEPTELVNRLGKDGLLTNIMNKLRDNPRLETVAAEVQSVGMRAVTKMLDLDKLKSGEHDDLLARLAEECNRVLHLDPVERRETAAKELSKAMNEHGFEVSDAVALELADKLIVDLGDDNEVTVDELRTYLIDIAEGRVEIPDEILPDDPGSLIPDGAL